MDRNLEQFIAIAEAGSYLAASEALAISQPALSYNLKKLEERLGVKLFKRSSRGVRLTPYGEILYENATMMQRLYSNAINSIAQHRMGEENGIKIGTGYSTWHLFLREIITEAYSARPDVPINVSLGNELFCMDQLLAGEIALFVGHHIANLAHDNMVDFIPLGRVQPAYSVRAGHPLLGAPRTLAEIRAYPCIQAKSHDERYKRLLEHGADGRSKIYPDMSHETRAPSFVSNSLAVCLDVLGSSDAVMFHNTLVRKLLTERGFHGVELASDEVLNSWKMGVYVNREKSTEDDVARLVALMLENRDRILDTSSR